MTDEHDDGPTPERLGQSKGREEAVTDEEGRDTGARRVRFNDDSPLDAYYRREQVDWRQHDAGSWMDREFRRSFRSGPALSSLEERVQTSTGPRDPLGAGAFDFKRALVRSGLAKITNAGRALQTGETEPTMRMTKKGQVALAVCCHGEWAGGTRKLDQLRAALDDLADYLKIGTRPAPVQPGDPEREENK